MQQIVIVGASFAGISVARHLISLGIAPDQISLVDVHDWFEYTPGILRSIVNPSHFDQLAFELRVLLQGALNGVRFIQAFVSSIDFAAKRINLVQNGADNQMEFAFCCVAVGNGYAAPIRSALPVTTFEQRKLELQRQNQRLTESEHVCVFGGGYVGVELVGELLETFPDKHIQLFIRGDRLLPDLPSKVGKLALDKLMKLGHLELIMNNQIAPSEYGALLIRSEVHSLISNISCTTSHYRLRLHWKWVSWLRTDPSVSICQSSM